MIRRNKQRKLQLKHIAYQIFSRKIFKTLLDFKDDGLLGNCAVWSGRSLPTFQRCLLLPSSGRLFIAIFLMMEAVSISETSVNFCLIKQRNFPELGHLHTRRRENLKSHRHWILSAERQTHVSYFYFSL
jgi:hypothetical protein